MNIFIVIPAYNEENKIADVISEVLRYYKNIIVVDDGSSDDTPYILDAIPNIIVCKHLVNRGQGASLVTGTRKALDLGADIIVHFDSDGQMRVEDIHKVIEPIIKEKYQVVIGSRFMDMETNIPRFRKIILKLAKVFNKYFLGINGKVKDPQSGFRAFSRDAAQKINITQDRMAHCSEILKEIYFKGLRVKEVPVKIIYTEYSLSKGQKASNALQIIWSLFIDKFSKK